MEYANCRSCKYYVPHYVNLKGELWETKGHCSKVSINGKPRQNKKTCGEWIWNAEKEKNNKKAIATKILSDMSEQLSELLLYLK